MTKYSVEPLNLGHIISVAANARQQDIDEAWAAGKIEPLEAMTYAQGVSREAWAGLADGKPVCAFGVAKKALLGTGVPWMIATKSLPGHARAFLRGNREYLFRIRREFPLLENYVDARNKEAIYWLRWLGFTIHEAQPYGWMQLPFHRFTMRGRG